MSSSLYQVRAYNIRHNCDVSDFLEAYRLLLQKAIDEIWRNIRWKEETIKGKKRLIPIIPKENSFKRDLRNLLLRDWSYCKHYADSAIKQAYSILKSWRRNYLKGKRGGNKPAVKKRFVRIKETLYTYRDGKIRVSVKPHKKCLEFDVSKAWFLSRIPKNAEMGELVLNEKYLTIAFRFRKKIAAVKGKIAWDVNEKSLDGFNPKLGWIRIDLAGLFHIHRVYELKRKRLQSLASKKPSLRKILAKYSRRERNRARDFVHKLTTFLARKFEGYIHGFENLEKDRMFSKSKEHNRNVAKSNWKMIFSFMKYKAEVKQLNPKNSTKRCSRCGGLNKASKGALYKCKCGLKIDRHLNASINLYLQMEGLPPSPKLFNELMKAWSGFTLLTGEEAADGSNEPARSLRLMNPKRNIPTVTFRHVSQNP